MCPAVTDQPDLSSPAELDTSVPDKAQETEMEHQAPGWRVSPSEQQSEVKNHVEQLRYGTHVSGLLQYAKPIDNAL
jgi:hypothetical protein